MFLRFFEFFSAGGKVSIFILWKLNRSCHELLFGGCSTGSLDPRVCYRGNSLRLGAWTVSNLHKPPFSGTHDREVTKLTREIIVSYIAGRPACLPS